jgi:hypothetical protein
MEQSLSGAESTSAPDGLFEFQNTTNEGGNIAT